MFFVNYRTFYLESHLLRKLVVMQTSETNSELFMCRFRYLHYRNGTAVTVKLSALNVVSIRSVVTNEIFGVIPLSKGVLMIESNGYAYVA